MNHNNKIKISQLNKKIKEEKLKSRLFGNKEGIETVCKLMIHIYDTKQEDGLDEIITRQEMESIVDACYEIIEKHQKKESKIIKP
jgi:hypothetical protein